MSTTTASAGASFALPLPYRLFFLLIEPISALLGAWYAHFHQDYYLQLTTPSLHSTPTSPRALDAATRTALSQLANLYMLFALIEATVLRSTSDTRVWRALLFALFVADLGHLYATAGTAGDGARGWSLLWRVDAWNVMDWGNIGFVYLGATMRLAFLLGVGLGDGTGGKKGVRSKTTTKAL